MEFVEFLWRHIIFVVIESGTYLVLFLYLADRSDFLQSNWVSCLFYVVLYVILTYFLSFNQKKQLIILYIIVFNVLMLAYITKMSLRFTIYINIIAALIYGITEIAIALPVLYIMDISLRNIFEGPPLVTKAQFIICSLQILTIYLITRLPLKKTLRKKKIREDKSAANFFLLILFIISVLYGSLVRYVDRGILIAGALLIASAVILMLKDTKERIRIIDIENQLKLQKDYSKNMEFIVDAVRKEKHDYKNHISTLVALCTMQEPETIDKVRSYALKLTNNEYNGGFHFYNTGNKYLDGLLAMKRNMAINKNIYFEVDVETTSEGIQVDDVDLTTIIGNIIDNAFDAVMMNPPEKKKIVSLSFYEEDKNYCIAISNNGNEITETQKNHIFEYKYSTKDKAEGERGYGLYIVNELTKKNHGNITFYSNELETEFLISFNIMN